MFQHNRKIKSKHDEFFVTADQFRALCDLYSRMNVDGDKTHPTFDDFLLIVQREFASAEENKPVPILVPFYGMLLGIELDGYCHS